MFRLCVEASVQGVVIRGLDNRIVYANPAMLTMVGVANAADLDDIGIQGYYDEESQDLLKGPIRRALLTRGHWSGELVMRTRQNAERNVMLSAFLIRNDAGEPTYLAGLVTDITERKQAQAALHRERQTLWHMLEASDNERQLIAYEIHDGLAQQLTAAMMQFQAYEHMKTTHSDQALAAFATGCDMLHHAHAETRRLISGVRPPVLDEAGVETAIAHLVHDRRVLQGPKIEFQSDVRFKRLPAIVENALYRIAQEALTNACKHSGSQRVRVTLAQEQDTIRLEIEDWGVGFNPAATIDGHFGLEGIRERVRLLGGQLQIDSGPQRGTLFRIEVPILERWQNGQA